jgi:hypothetical protein
MKNEAYRKTGNHNEYVFAPGCALILYKPELSEKLHFFLQNQFGEMDIVQTCCRHEPEVEAGSTIINVCPGCDKRFSNDYKNISTISLWEILAEGNSFDFPDYGGKKMTIMDACPTRDKERVQTAIRMLLERMNIDITEPERTKTKSICCGDSFYGAVSTRELKGLMTRRAAEMPVDEVAVYCVSCIKSAHIGGKKPGYLIDLLFDEKTIPGNYEPDEWHAELTRYIEQH